MSELTSVQGAAPLLPARPTVLAVDDDPVIQRILALMLDKHEVEALTCGSVDQALSHLATRSIHLIICDYLMPDRDGLDLLEAISPSPIPFVLMSGFRNRASIRDERIDGVAAFLTKRVSSADLKTVLDIFLPRPGGPSGP